MDTLRGKINTTSFNPLNPNENQARSMVYTEADRKRDQARAAEGTFDERQRRGFITKKIGGAFKDRFDFSKVIQTKDRPTTDMGLKPIGIKINQNQEDRHKGFNFGDPTEAIKQRFADRDANMRQTSSSRRSFLDVPKITAKGGVNPRTEGLTDEQIRMGDYLRGIATPRKGGMLSGSYEGMGKLTIIHGGARAARAAIVKKVMAEQGCSMPQASKYVKEHGLYKGGGTRSKSKPSKKEKNPYGRTHTSELSLGMTKKVRKPAQAPPADQPDVGLALDLPPPPKGKGRRAPAGPSDGRRARAAIVKRVMGEKGCSMIEASKYVKEHNLY